MRMTSKMQAALYWARRRRMDLEVAPETSALVARMTVKPTAARLELIDDTIVKLKDAGIWAKLDCLYFMAASDSQVAKLNWKSSNFNLTEVSAPAFVADRGFTGNGTTSCLDTGFNPTTAAGQYALNSASAGVYCRTSAALSNTAMADLGTVASGVLRVASRVTGDLAVFRLNRNANATPVSTDGKGLFHASRVLSGSYKGYKNGVETADFAGTTSTGIPNENVFLLKDTTFFSNHEISAAFLGAGLSGPESAAVASAIIAYIQGVGAG